MHPCTATTPSDSICVSLNLSLLLMVLLLVLSVLIENVFSLICDKGDWCWRFVINLMRLPRLLSASVMSGFTLYHIKQH